MSGLARPNLPTLGDTVESQRTLAGLRKISDDLLRDAGLLRRYSPDEILRPVSSSRSIIALKWDSQNRVSLTSDTICQLPRVETRRIGAPLYLFKATPVGKLTLVPAGFGLDRTVHQTIHGLASVEIADAGLYCLISDGTNWAVSSLGNWTRFDVRFFGARAGGSAAINQAAFQAAFNAVRAAGGGIVYVPDGTFKLTGNLVMYSNTWVYMSPATTLDISASGSVDALTATGSESATMALTANAAKGATTITLSAPNAATLSQGSWIRVASDTVFDASDTNSEIGEIVEVKSVSGTTVTLETPLRGGAYNTASNAVATKITFVENIRVYGGEIVGGGTVTTTGSDADCNGITIFLGKRCFVQEVAFQRCDLASVWFRDSIFSKVRECHFKDAVNDNQGYGVLWDNACQDCAIEDCTSERVRHIVTMGNSTATKGVTRRIRYLGLQVYSTTPARGGSGGDAIDTHAAAEDVQIECCSVYSSSGGGINVECASAQIRGCQVFNTTDYGIIYHNESDQEGEILIEGCRVVGTGTGGTWEGIRVNMPTRGGTAKNKSVRIANNEVDGCSGIGIYVVNSVSATRQKNISIVGNAVSRAGSASASIYLEDCEGGTVTGNSVCEPTNTAQQAIQIRDCKNIAVNDNAIKHADSSTGVGVYINASSAGSCTGIIVQGNTVSGVTPVSLRGVVIDNNATNCIIGKNNLVDCNTQFVRGTGTGHDVVDDLFSSVQGIVFGAITINRNWQDVVVDTEGLAATDDLDTISGGNRGQIIVIRENSSGRTVKVRHVGGGTGNIILTGAVDFTFGSSNSTVALQWGGTFWREIGRCV